MKTWIITLFAGLVIFSSCGTSNVKEPEYREIRDIHLVELGLLQSTAGISLVYYNPNKFGVKVSEARGDMYVDNQYFGRIELGEAVQVAKHAEFVLPAIIKIDMVGLIKNQRELLNKKEVMVKIKGLAKVSKGAFTRELPIEFENMQNIEQFRTLLGK